MRGWWSGHKVIDPSEMEARFATEDGLAFLDATGSEEITDEGLEQLDRVKDVLGLLPEIEADFVECYYIRHMKQTSIAEIFGVSQPTVCYRLQRAADRIRFLLELPDLADNELQIVLEGFLSDELDVKIMLLMYETTCQSEVAKRLGVSQGLVRHRFMKTIRLLSNAEGMEKYHRMFQAIADNLNILREVQRPTWNHKVAYVLA